MEKLKNRIAFAQDRIERFSTNTNKTAKSKRDKEFLTARIELLEAYWAQFTSDYEQFYENSSAETLAADPYVTSDVFSDVECIYIESKQSLREQLATFNPATSSHNHEGFSLQSTLHTHSSSTVPLKLPKINLPSFSGSLTEWPSFHDTYVSLIHENDSLPDVQKLHYLKSAITGEAAKLLRHFTTTSANYNSAWKLVINRYENKRILVNTNLHSLISLPSMARESFSELQRVFDTFKQSVRALENLSRPVDKWDDWLTYFLANKLDATTRKDWETSLSSSTDVPTFIALSEFLERRLQALSALKDTQALTNIIPYQRNYTGQKQRTSLRTSARTHHLSTSTSRTSAETGSSTSARTCWNCNGKHPLLFCPQFRSMPSEQRLDLLQRKQACKNCLKSNHTAAACASLNRCKICQEKHHTMIHSSIKPTESTPSQMKNTSTVSEALCPSTKAHLSLDGRTLSSVLLPTALLRVESANGRHMKVRALLDQGSESNFITASLANLLNLRKQKTRTAVFGIGQCEAGIAYARVEHDVISLQDSTHRYSVNSLVLPTLSQLLPGHAALQQAWPHLLNLPLADPNFDQPSTIDLILGAEVYAQIILGEVRRGPPGAPVAQATVFGWIVSGAVDTTTNPAPSTMRVHTSTREVDSLLRRFWELQEPPQATRLTPNESQCEDHFAQTHSRDTDGRYIVSLPLKLPSSSLGSSRGAAMSSLLRMQRRLQRDPELKNLYSSFMAEYEDLDHMEEVAEETTTEPIYYLPHHAVLKPSSTTTKLRVVFNASQKTTSHFSLNDILHVGPKLQNDVFAVILRWRLYPHVLTGDIEKMYRQIRVSKADTNLQRILWSPSSEVPVKCYRLLTVTYGTACAPYLACKTLQQLANDYASEYPTASRIINENFYVDDALFGAYDKETAVGLRDDLCSLLKKGGFKLRKWLANSASLLAGIAEEDQAHNLSLKVVKDVSIKTLGTTWNPTSDEFSFSIHLCDSPTSTKRSVLADISRLYDPLGWLSPVTITAKILLQRLWLATLDWDDQLPDDLHQEWRNYKRELKSLAHLRISRWVGTTGNPLGLELHGFSDASLSAYGAAVYLRVIHDLDNFQVSLLAAKTRVSPLKTISLPRLELCGAALLAELVHHIITTLNFNKVPVYLWSDSTVVLEWLREHPSKWKVFVANRVALIHEKVPNATWHHIQSADNPSDCITRGITASSLNDYLLWWSGPPWLSQSSESWPQGFECRTNHPLTHELEKNPRNTHTFVAATADFAPTLLQTFSTLKKLIRVTGYLLRFIHNCRTRSAKQTDVLTLEEHDRALTLWIKIVQHSTFSLDVTSLKRKQLLPANSKLRSVNPFIDSNDVLRVGGRLRHAHIAYDEKFPIILPKANHLTTLIIRESHFSTLHGGVQATLHHIRSRYWILRGRSMVRQFVKTCVVCCRYNPTSTTQLMGDLPADRLRPAKPFLHSGVDYAGPFITKLLNGRGHKTTKTYVALFVCFATRAIHLELVLDLTSAAFIAAFRRFVSRRGRCAKLYSDNARTFVAADKELSHHLRQLTSSQSEFTQLLINDGTEWHFIPPASPHFGGIWEAGVKAFKHHFRRIVGSHILTLEEMLTLLAQVEACLNSRPLNAITDDPGDLTPLTPGHFLVGEQLLAVPTPSTLDMSLNRLTRWQLTQHLHEQLWRRWSHEYIHTLQARYKRQRPQDPVKINDLVLIKEDNLPPSKWLLGRVTQLHPGEDDLSHSYRSSSALSRSRRADRSTVLYLHIYASCWDRDSTRDGRNVRATALRMMIKLKSRQHHRSSVCCCNFSPATSIQQRDSEPAAESLPTGDND